MGEPVGKIGKVPGQLTELMKALGMNQAQFAKALGVGQGNVSKWLKGTRPTPDVLSRIATLAPDEFKFFFLEEAGVPKEFFMGTIKDKLPSQMIAAVDAVVTKAFYGQPQADKTSATLVPVLADAAAAGNPLTINERDIASVLPLPTTWLPKNGTLYILTIEGDSMEPKLSDGDLVIVDVAKRDPAKLNKAMVAVRVDDGVTVKYLRKNGKFWQLVPQHVSPRHDIRILTDEDNWSIVGEVVKCIVNPPPRGRK